jgi:hypothetical protein
MDRNSSVITDINNNNRIQSFKQEFEPIPSQRSTKPDFSNNNDFNLKNDIKVSISRSNRGSISNSKTIKFKSDKQKQILKLKSLNSEKMQKKSVSVVAKNVVLSQ